MPKENSLAKILRSVLPKKKKVKYEISQLSKQKVFEEMSKGFLSMDKEAGLHAHGLPRNLLKTWKDGKHRHLFAIMTINGGVELFPSEEDGEHEHSLEEVTSLITTTINSRHTHVIRITRDIVTLEGLELKSGMVFLTDFSGQHAHGADMLETTNFDGTHFHLISLGELKDGTKVVAKSIDVADFWNMFGPLDLSDVRPINNASDITLSRMPLHYLGEIHPEFIAKELEQLSVLHAAFGVEAKETGKEIIVKQIEVSELMFSKRVFKTPLEAKEKALELNYPTTEEPEATTKEFRIRVQRPSLFIKESLKTILLETGVKAIVGDLKTNVTKEQLDFRYMHTESTPSEQVLELFDIRSGVYGIEKLQIKKDLMLISDNDYFGDPVNLSYKIDSIENAVNARNEFKASGCDQYKNSLSRNIVHERIIKAELNLGGKPTFNYNDKHDQLISYSLQEIIKGANKDEIRKSLDALPENVEIIKQDNDAQIVIGVVLEPDTSDAEGDVITPEEIEKAQNFFMMEGQVIGFRHKGRVKNAKVVQSYIAPIDMVIEGQKVKKSSWILGVHIQDKSLWADIKAKRINGFSVGGFGIREKIAN